ncbi:MAG: hypothetical protein IT162_00710 [Bryobacterales bacterium]|nr:hypothetical protein [Bryobacterales bacterium]
MPFSPAFPRPFAANEISANVPETSGIYGVSNAGEWIYIGETPNLRSTLLGLLQRPNASLDGRVPTGFVFEVCAEASRPERQHRLVLEYKPTCNQETRRR